MLIGLTGGIGSGKSTIARALAARGFAVYDCDREAKRIIAENPAVQQQIIALFGEEAFVDGVYNTQYISKCVFSPPSGGVGEGLTPPPGGAGGGLQALNAIIHPAVKEDILSSPFRGTKRGSRGLLFIESAILFESGLDALCDRIIIVDAPEDIRIARTIARDYHGDATPENINKVCARIRAQDTLSPFRGSRRGSCGAGGSLIILNDGSVSISDLADTILHWLQK
ncbi:MAG: dephospho-CoA kinase [Paludibacteraceae bacterium]|nr:dephospho-CoA kinase [Paludibacteraceae bacterium]